MSLKIYDDGLLFKLKQWTDRTNAHIYGPDEIDRVYQTLGDETDDSNVKLPLIVLTRPFGYEVTNINKKPLSFDGIKFEVDEEGNAYNINALPITITYQLDIFCRYVTECDEYVRNLLFAIINNPTFAITLPYHNKKYTHYANIRVDNQVRDTSNIQQRLVSGQFTRMTLLINIDDAYLWDLSEKHTVQIVPSDGFLMAQNPDGLTFVTENYENT